jgi:predicted component of type VI protein secretion system
VGGLVARLKAGENGAVLEVDVLQVPGGRRTLRVDKDNIVVGRSAKCDVIVRDPDVSRRHVRVELVNGELWAEDMGSSNGSLVDGEPLARRSRIPEGALIRVCDHEIRVRIVRDAPQQQVQQAQPQQAQPQQAQRVSALPPAPAERISALPPPAERISALPPPAERISAIPPSPTPTHTPYPAQHMPEMATRLPPPPVAGPPRGNAPMARPQPPPAPLPPVASGAPMPALRPSAMPPPPAAPTPPMISPPAPVAMSASIPPPAALHQSGSSPSIAPGALRPSFPSSGPRTSRTFQCSEAQWQRFEQIAREQGVTVDDLLNDALAAYGRRRMYADAGSAQAPHTSLQFSDAPPIVWLTGAAAAGRR